MNRPFELTVILAEAAGNPGIGLALTALETACSGIATEVLVVRPLGRPPFPLQPNLILRELICAEETLVPERWGIGVRAAQAPIFGCLTSELLVHADWAPTLIVALTPESAGAAGAIELAPQAGMTAAAIYMIRFGAFLPVRNNGAWRTANIPGDAAMYRRDAALAFPDLLAEGFWEAEFHRRWRAANIPLRYLGKSLVSFRTSLSLGSAIRIRYQHAFGYGVSRVRRYGESVARILLVAPLVPLVLLIRMLSRASVAPGATRHFLRALPATALLAVAWGWGEAVGAWSARGKA